MEEIECRGRTVAEAITAGLKQLGIEKKEAEIKILDEGNAGLFGLMGARPALVKIKKISDENTGDLTAVQTTLKEIIAGMLSRMGLDYSEIRTSLLTGRISLNIFSADASIIIGRDGQTLKAIETIAKLILWKNPAQRIKFSLDCMSWRQKKQEKLIEQAKEIVALVKKAARPQHLEPMDAADRRVIHTALANVAGIETISEGEGEQRHIVIRLRRSQK